MRLLRRRHQLDAIGTATDGVYQLGSNRASLPSGWVALDLEIGGVSPVSPCLLVNGEVLPLPLPRRGRIRALVELPARVEELALETGPARPGRLLASELGVVEVALRLGTPVIRRRLAEPWSIPVSGLRLGRALLDGTLFRRLSQKASHETPQLRYPEWHRVHGALSGADRAAIRAAIARLDHPPRFSVIVPAGAERTLRSVRGQLYGNFGVCASLAQADGDFAVLLDGDDELAEHALYLYADAICSHRDAGLLYGDEDRIDPRGVPCLPDFKPDWNPDLLLSRDYLGHACAVRAAAARAMDPREFFLVAQPVIHVPFVVNHRHAPDAPGSPDAIQRFLGSAAAVESGPLPSTRRICWKLPSPPPLASLIIPTRNGREVLEPCVESLVAHTAYRPFEILIVDNGSDEPATLEYLRSLEDRGAARVLRYPHPFNFSAINNFAVREARGEVVGLLNNDLEFTDPGWLAEMVSHALRPGVGCVGARLLYPDGTVQHAGVVLGIGGVADHVHKFLPAEAPGYCGRAQLTQDFSAVTAACLLIRRETYLDVGGFDEELAVAFNDVDFCLRVRERGLRNVWTPFATVIHHESKSRGREDTLAKMLRFRGEIRRLKARWGKALLEDPAYNPNLTLDATNFSLAWPPRVRPPWK